VGVVTGLPPRHRLLVRFAADSTARRGELAVLRFGDLDGQRVLTIERGPSQGMLGSTKSRRTRRLTLGATTATLIGEHFSV
jgi:integrase